MTTLIPKRATLLLPILILALIPFYCYSQQTQTAIVSDSQVKKPVRIGLALSGGGAKGFAHVGILKVFEDEGIPIHMMSGTSIGAIVGSLYAIGYSPGEIETIATHTDWAVLFNDSYRINPQNLAKSVSSKDTYLLTLPMDDNKLKLPAGLIDGRNVSMMLYRLMLPYHDISDFTQLPIPFAPVATNLSTGKAHTFHQGYLPDAVRASSAIPTIFRPVVIDGQTYVDGGVARNLPAVDVRELGADIVISSDVGEPVKPVDSLKTFVQVLFQSVGFHQLESDIRQKKATDFYIRPDIEEFSSFSYDHIAEIIDRGEQAAREIVPLIKTYLRNHEVPPTNFRPLSKQQKSPLLISEVTYSNISGLLQKQAKLTLDINPPLLISYSDIERRINRLYRSGLFSQISYRLQSDPSSREHRLLLEFQKKEQEYAGFSMRYDSKYKAALLFGASLSDNLLWGDQLTAHLRVGEVLELSTNYTGPITLSPLSNFNFHLNFQRTPIDYYIEKQAVSSIGVERITASPAISIHFLDDISLKGGLQTEIYSLNEAVGNTLVLENSRLLVTGYGELGYNTLNRPYFPTHGQRLHMKSAFSNRGWGSSETFYQFTADWEATFPLGGGFNFTNEVFAGFSSNAEIPLHYNYYLGGLSENPIFNNHQLPFMGYAAQQLRSANAVALRSELQFKVNKNIYLGGGWNAAHLSDRWTLNLDRERMRYGYSLFFGALTIIGPVELNLSAPNLSEGYALKIDVGYHF